VRVVRATEGGYRYDGLYRVEDYWHDRGKSGYLVWRFRLTTFKEEPPRQINEGALAPEAATPPERRQVTVSRIIRDTAEARRVKQLYDFTCQVCGTRLVAPAGLYAEGAHIKPLGAPHNGPDRSDNILCLCPNHHTLFDLGAFTIDENLCLIGLGGTLTVRSQHKIDMMNLRYHREHYSKEDR
jgi:putative restriction endonuclease